jgi:hypothetical protein
MYDYLVGFGLRGMHVWALGSSFLVWRQAIV